MKLIENKHLQAGLKKKKKRIKKRKGELRE